MLVATLQPGGLFVVDLGLTFCHRTKPKLVLGSLQECNKPDFMNFCVAALITSTKDSRKGLQRIMRHILVGGMCSGW